jgi:hypothetical protein
MFLHNVWPSLNIFSLNDASWKLSVPNFNLNPLIINTESTDGNLFTIVSKVLLSLSRFLRNPCSFRRTPRPNFVK